MARSQLPTAIKIQPKQQRAKQSLETILATTLALGIRHGVAGFTTNQIAEEGGVDVSSIYRFFDNLPSIWLHIAEQWIIEIQSEYEKFESSTDSDTAEIFFVALFRHWLTKDNIKRSKLLAGLWHAYPEFVSLNNRQFEFHHQFCRKHLLKYGYDLNQTDMLAFSRFTYICEDAITEGFDGSSADKGLIKLYELSVSSAVRSFTD